MNSKTNNYAKSLRLDDKLDLFRILIVDDNPVDREIIKSHLDSIGFRNIQMARNGNEGIFKIENSSKVRKPFHIVITDWKMPEKDGLSMLKILNASSNYKDMRVIMMTTVSDKNQVKEALREGVDAFILKPIDTDVLEDKILNLTEKIDLLGTP